MSFSCKYFFIVYSSNLHLATLYRLYYAKTGPQLDPRKNVVCLHKNQLKNIKRVPDSFAILFWLSVVSHKNENPGVCFLSVLPSPHQVLLLKKSHCKISNKLGVRNLYNQMTKIYSSYQLSVYGGQTIPCLDQTSPGFVLCANPWPIITDLG